MFIKILGLTAALIVAIDGAKTGSKWDYDHPNNWPDLCLEGQNQSPINIDLSSVRIDETLESLQFQNYGKGIRFSATNNGHGVSASIDRKYNIKISAGGLPVNYNLVNFHFHWAQNDHQGSEHKLNGLQYPLEMHLVHMKEGYGSLTEAVKYPDGLAVVGVFFAKSDKGNQGLDEFLQKIDDLELIGNNTDFEEFRISHLVPEWTEREVFFRYNGSLTTPGCQEVVTWTVLASPSNVSDKQLSKFRQIRKKGGKILERNDRPAQSLNDRKVVMRHLKSSKDTSMESLNEKSSETSSSARVHAGILTSLLIVKFSF